MFAGQYADNESGLFYNYFRTYNPSVGRYIQSDPIGLRGGINTYAYVNANPLIGIDPLGLVGASAQFGYQAAAYMFIGGFSVTGGGIAGGGTEGAGVCSFIQVCMRIGPSVYAGGGLAGGVSGFTGALSDAAEGFSVGLGADIGAGGTVGGQVGVGFNDKGEANSAGMATGHAGWGAGISIGIDFCWMEVECEETETCPK